MLDRLYLVKHGPLSVLLVDPASSPSSVVHRPQVGYASMPSVRRDSVHSTASRLVAVERAEAYVRAHAGTSVPISRLSRIVGLSERCLRNAFYGVRGMSPRRRFIAEREIDMPRMGPRDFGNLTPHPQRLKSRFERPFDQQRKLRDGQDARRRPV